LVGGDVCEMCACVCVCVCVSSVEKCPHSTHAYTRTHTHTHPHPHTHYLAPSRASCRSSSFAPFDCRVAVARLASQPPLWHGMGLCRAVLCCAVGVFLVVAFLCGAPSPRVVSLCGRVHRCVSVVLVGCIVGCLQWVRVVCPNTRAHGPCNAFSNTPQACVAPVHMNMFLQPGWG